MKYFIKVDNYLDFACSLLCLSLNFRKQHFLLLFLEQYFQAHHACLAKFLKVVFGMFDKKKQPTKSFKCIWVQLYKWKFLPQSYDDQNCSNKSSH